MENWIEIGYQNKVEVDNSISVVAHEVIGGGVIVLTIVRGYNVGQSSSTVFLPHLKIESKKLVPITKE